MAVFIADMRTMRLWSRTGKFFSQDHSGVNAGIYTMAKGMGNGFPVQELSSLRISSLNTEMLGTTFGGNPWACAAALAVLEVIEEEHLLANAATVGEYLINELKNIPQLKNVRGKGLMIGFDVRW